MPLLPAPDHSSRPRMSRRKIEPTLSFVPPSTASVAPVFAATRRNHRPAGGLASTGAVSSEPGGAVSSEPGPARVSEWGASARESAPAGDTRHSSQRILSKEPALANHAQALQFRKASKLWSSAE